MPTKGTGDPLLKGKDWQGVRAYWLKLKPPTCEAPTCRARHVPIDYGPQRGPWSLDVGHIVSRGQAKAAGWTRAQINAISNTRPEHQGCNRRQGASDGNRARARSTSSERVIRTSREW